MRHVCKRAYKRILSFFLICAMTFGTCVVSSAEDVQVPDGQGEDETVCMTEATEATEATETTETTKTTEATETTETTETTEATETQMIGGEMDAEVLMASGSIDVTTAAAYFRVPYVAT